jgi:hypothetical protein
MVARATGDFAVDRMDVPVMAVVRMAVVRMVIAVMVTAVRRVGTISRVAASRR